MKKYFTIVAGMLVTALIFTSCGSFAQAGYNYGYGDGQPDNDYYYNNYNQQPDPNDMAYQQPAGQAPVGFNDFYNQLSPYGSWVNIAPYGQVWIANVPNFQPYSTNGYWTYTTYGWTWVSSYSWGWAPFHYGRWGYNNRYGWYWVPGYSWGPAWVAWSSSADMYGWAPLMPGMNFGVTLSVNLFPSSYWTFMPGRYMGMNNIGNYYVNRSRNVTIIKNTTIINNYGTENNRRYTMGPTVNDVQRYNGGRTIQPMRVTSVQDNRSAGVGSDELRVYRPVTRTDNSASNNRGTTNPSYNNNNSNNNRGGTTNPSNNNSSNNNRTSTTQTQTRTQPVTQPTQQPATRTTVPQTQTRTQPPTQPAQQPATRTIVPQTQTQTQTRTQPAAQSAPQQSTTYQRNPAQPKVTNPAAPQTTKQIQAAQNENRKVEQQQQQRSSTQAPSRSSSTGSGSQQRR